MTMSPNDTWGMEGVNQYFMCHFFNYISPQKVLKSYVLCKMRIIDHVTPGGGGAVEGWRVMGQSHQMGEGV